MKVKKIPLISPSKSPIVGLRTKSGEVCTVKCKYSRIHGQPNFFFEYEKGMGDELEEDDDGIIFVDGDGKQWNSGDVMWASAPKIS